MVEAQPTAPRVGYLDGLRGVAALLVVFFHASSAFMPAIVFGTDRGGLAHVLYATPILNVWMQGNFMVCVFYALSGFALAYGSLSRGGLASTISGLVRRWPRLAIPTTCATMAGFVLLKLDLFRSAEAAKLSGSKWFGGFWQFHPSLTGALRQGAVGVFASRSSGYDPPLWTMHNELLGSLLVFAVLLFAPRWWLRVVSYVVLAFFTYHSYLLGFVAGMAICDITLAMNAANRQLTRKHVWWAAPLGVLGLVLGSYPTPSATMPHFYDHLLPHIYGSGEFSQEIGTQVLGAIFVLIALVVVAPIQQVFESRPMQFLGRISFALYLLHFLVLGSLGAEVLILLHGPLPYGVSAVVAFVTVVAISLAAAWVFTRVVDEPAVGWLKRTYRAIARRVVHTVPVTGRVLLPEPARARTAPVDAAR